MTKSKIIPEPARALAHALKNAVVKPIRTITKKKSLDANLNDQQTPHNHQTIVHSLSTPTSILIENFDQPVNELSVDSYESTSASLLASLPSKPPRVSDESCSSSSIEINSPPPAKPPRHFSLYKNESEKNLIQQTNDVVKRVLNLVDTFPIVPQNDNDINFVKAASSNNQDNSNNIKTLETFSTVSMTNFPLITNASDNNIDKQMTINSLSSSLPSSIEQSNCSNKLTEENIPTGVIQLATNLTESILQKVEQQTKLSNDDDDDSIRKSNRQTSLCKPKQLKQEELTRLSCNYVPLMPLSVITTHVLPTQVTSRPLMSVSFNSSSHTSKPLSPVLDVVTPKTTPLITASVTVISPSMPKFSSTAKIISSDDELRKILSNDSNSNENSNAPTPLQSRSKQSSIDSDETTTSENVVFKSRNTERSVPTSSMAFNYDNLYDSTGSLNDDHRQRQNPPSSLPPIPSSSETLSSTASSSMTTIYESFENFPSFSSSTTSPTYVSAASTFDTGGTTTPRRLNSDMSDDDLVVSLDDENLNQGRKFHIQNHIKHGHILILFLACHLPSFVFFNLFSLQLAWQNQVLNHNK